MFKILKIIFFSLFVLNVNAQSIDRVEAIIGDEIVLSSDIESQYIQYLAQGNLHSEQVKCEMVEDILFQKLLVNQAKIDSVVVNDEDVYSEISKRLNYFETQLGSLQKVEEYFGKSKADIEVELARLIKEQFLAQKVQASISSAVKITPVEVREFFREHKSDIPIVPAKVELLQLVVKPEISDQEKNKLRDKLNGFRARVYKGEDFKMLAALYSDDDGSAARGGDLGFVNRGDLVPEFERAAFRLKQGEISEVVESEFGFHIIQLIERRGEQINVRHILLRNKVSSTALYNAKIKIEDIEREIKSGIITFEDAISKYSDDESKKNGGLLLNINTMSTMHIIEEMSPGLRNIVEKLDTNEMSGPVLTDIPNEMQVYRILKLNKRVDSHKANLVDDFSMIKGYAEQLKIQDNVMFWIQKTIDKTYIKINDGILNCVFKNKWIK